MDADEDGTDAYEHRNVVLLTGRLAAAPVSRELPSGDALVQWRLVVARPAAAASSSGPRGTTDTVDCTAWPAGLRKRVSGWRAGDLIEVEGALRRRFWRTDTGPASRYEVEVRAARRLRRAPAESGTARRRSAGPG